MFLFKSILLESFFQAFLDSSSRGAPASRVIQVELPQQGYVQRSLLGNQEPRSGRKSAGTEQITTAGKPTSCAGLLLPVHTCLISQGTVNRSVKSLVTACLNTIPQLFLHHTKVCPRCVPCCTSNTGRFDTWLTGSEKQARTPELLV